MTALLLALAVASMQLVAERRSQRTAEKPARDRKPPPHTCHRGRAAVSRHDERAVSALPSSEVFDTLRLRCIEAAGRPLAVDCFAEMAEGDLGSVRARACPMRNRETSSSLCSPARSLAAISSSRARDSSALQVGVPECDQFVTAVTTAC